MLRIMTKLMHTIFYYYMLSIIMLSVVKMCFYIDSQYTLWYYGECHYDDSHKAEYQYA